MRELERILPAIEPPAGGLARLQRRIASQGRARRAPRIGRWAWAVAACAALVVVATSIQPWAAGQQRANALAAALRAAVAGHRPAGGIRVTDGAAIELPSGQDNVRLYLVQTVPRTRGGK